MITASRGTQDFYGEDCERLSHLESIARNCLQQFNFKEIRTPIFEDSALFTRGVGENNDVVKKEMYRFKDKGNRDLTLRPEGTASVIRSIIQHQLYRNVQRLFYIGPFFRYERPQAGRFRQFHQIGAELIGEKSAYADFVVMDIAYKLFKKLGINDLYSSLNTIGDHTCKPQITTLIKSFFHTHHSKLSEHEKETLDKNPLRLLDTKNKSIQILLENLPDIRSVLNQESLDHFSLVCSLLKHAKIPFKIDPLLVRGLDYYTHTTFEIRSEKLGSQSALCGGGRYDNLIEILGGKSTPSVGFAFGVERLLLLTKNTNIENNRPKIAFIALGKKSVFKAISLLATIRKEGDQIFALFEYTKLDKALRQANRDQADYCIILGENELKNNELIFKNLVTGSQKKTHYNEFSNQLKIIRK